MQTQTDIVFVELSPSVVPKKRPRKGKETWLTVLNAVWPHWKTISKCLHRPSQQGMPFEPLRDEPLIWSSSEHSTTNDKHFSSTQLHLRGWMSYGCVLKGTMPMSCSTPSQSMCSISFVSFNVLSIHAPRGVSTPQDVRDRAITTV